MRGRFSSPMSIIASKISLPASIIILFFASASSIAWHANVTTIFYAKIRVASLIIAFLGTVALGFAGDGATLHDSQSWQPSESMMMRDNEREISRLTRSWPSILSIAIPALWLIFISCQLCFNSTPKPRQRSRPDIAAAVNARRRW